MADSPLTFAAQQTLPNTAPVHQSAGLNLPGGLWQITYDQKLHTQVLDPSLFTFTINMQTVTATAAIASGFQVFGASNVAAGGPAADTISYSANPPSVRNTKMLQAAPFAGFPLAVT